mgnify:CR=1 FL=1
MGNLLKAMVFVAVAWYAWHQQSTTNGADITGKLAPGNQVVMYSLTTCGYCAEKRERMTTAGIPFTASRRVISAAPAMRSTLARFCSSTTDSLPAAVNRNFTSRRLARLCSAFSARVFATSSLS